MICVIRKKEPNKYINEIIKIDEQKRRKKIEHIHKSIKVEFWSTHSHL